MTAPIDIHPEDLLDAERAGVISPADLARLDAHARTCRSCALERRAAADFERGRAVGPADEALSAALVDRVLAAPRPVVTAPRRRRAWLLVAVAAVFVGATTAAAIELERRDVIDLFDGGEVEPVPAPAPPPEPRRPRPAPRPAPQPEPALPAPSPPEPTAATEPEPVREEGRDRAAPQSAAELFAEANAARRAGRHREAVALYQRLGREHPASREARASRVSAGNLLLHQLGDPAGALRQFDAYLAAGGAGPLALEARVGRAIALGRLGRRDAERAAWQAVLEYHPGTVHADRARRRLEELR